MNIHPTQYIDVIVRIMIAAICGGLIGMTREKIHRPAGTRTHSLIALGSCILTVVSIYSFYDPVTKSGDPGRLAAQIITSIGFLGAGTIIKRDFTVKGLTTAATLWVSMAIGITFGAGEYLFGIMSTLLTLVVVMSTKITRSKKTALYIFMVKDYLELTLILKMIESNKFLAKVVDREFSGGNEVYTVEITKTNGMTFDELKDKLLKIKGLRFMEES